MARGDLLWEPSAQLLADAEITRYRRWLEAERGLAFAGYQELWAWSVAELEPFWASIWDYFEVRAARPYERVLGARSMPGAEWFPGAELSYAEHVFRGRHEHTVAIVHASELRAPSELCWGELRGLCAGIAAGLRELGVGRGDRVAAYLPNIPEAAAAFLACASIGAIWSSCSPDFGAASVIDRFAQIRPKVLLAVDGYRYGGRDFDRRETVARLGREIPGLERTVLLPYLDARASLAGTLPWAELPVAGELAFEQLPFEHPLWVLYTSGTTGLPKAIVHGQGGILLEHLKEVRLHIDARAGDRLFWFTTTGWMMWNLLLGGLLSEAAVVLYDGSPVHPETGALWGLAESAGITCLGTSPAYIETCMRAGVAPRAGRRLARLRSIGATGSPLSPEAFRWVYAELGPDPWLFSMSGGTDVCTAFLGGVPTLPVYEGELQARALGAMVEAYDDDARPLIGEVGELVLSEPLPSMPVFLWGDEGGRLYRESYFAQYPGVWRHGDWLELTSRSTAIIYGRSDSTINRGGVRIGTSEIYRAVLALDGVLDALVIDIPRAGAASWMPLFVVLAAEARLDEALEAEIKRSVRERCSPRHVPDEVRQIPEVPRTLSGKILEVPVRRILMGAPPEQVVSRDSLANPHALDYFSALSR